ncbi:hypothetical protein SLE2022_402380 [Rubroshorea leprosula]
MVMASVSKVVLGSIAFGIFWVMAVFPSVPFLPIGRTAGSLLGAMLMVLFGVITPDQAYAAIDLPILGLLFATMVVTAYLERADMFKYLGKLLAWKSKGAKDLICRICVIAAISSAFFTNDTVCVVLTEFVLKVARQHNLPPHPFLIALASSANIGSATTRIGNPQNLVIAIQSKIHFGEFVLGILPSMLMGIRDEEDATAEVVGDEDVASHRFSPATLSNHHPPEWNSRLAAAAAVRSSPNMKGTPPCEIQKASSSGFGSVKSPNASKEEENDVFTPQKKETAPPKKITSMDRLREALPPKWKKILWKVCVYLFTISMLVALLMGLNMSWTTITAALFLVVLDFKDAEPCLEKVSYSLLVFFCGMFITVDGFNKTGIPSSFWDSMERYSKVNHVSGVAVLAIVILVLSNLASNVPTVLLLGGRVAASAAAISPTYEKKAWLILAWVSTIAGNLSLLGSAANLIVCEQARRAPNLGYTLSLWTHLKFGVPSTLVVTVIGLTVMRG